MSFIDTLLSAKLPLSGSSTYSIQSYLQGTFVQHSPVFLPIAWPAHSPFQRTCFPRCNLLLCATLCHPMGCSPPGASVHGISQARILERAAVPSSRGSSQARDQTHVSLSPALQVDSLSAEPSGSPRGSYNLTQH